MRPRSAATRRSAQEDRGSPGYQYRFFNQWQYRRQAKVSLVDAEVIRYFKEVDACQLMISPLSSASSPDLSEMSKPNKLTHEQSVRA